MPDIEIISLLARQGIAARQNVQIRARGYPERCALDEPFVEARNPTPVQPRVTPRPRETNPFGRLREVPSGLDLHITPPIRYRSGEVARAIRSIRLRRQTQ